MPGYDDPFWRVLVDGDGIRADFTIGLPKMWDEVGKALGGRVRFLDEEPS